MLGNFPCFCCRLQTFSKSTFSKNSFGNTIRVSISLDQNKGRQFVGTDLGRNCLQRLSADNKSHHLDKEFKGQLYIRANDILIML